MNYLPPSSNKQLSTLFKLDRKLYNNIFQFIRSFIARRNPDMSRDQLDAIKTQTITHIRRGYTDNQIYKFLRKDYFRTDHITETDSGNTAPGVVNTVFQDNKRNDDRVEQIVKRFPKNFRPKSVLDIGCGDGAILSGLSDKLGIGNGDLHGADIVPLQNTDFVFHHIQQGNFSLNIPDNSIDLVTVFMVLHHILDVEKSLSEVFRILRPGGILIIREHDCNVEKNPGLAVYLDIIHGLYMVSFSDPQETDDFSKEKTFYRDIREWDKLITVTGLKRLQNMGIYNTPPVGDKRTYYAVYSKSEVGIN